MQIDWTFFDNILTVFFFFCILLHILYSFWSCWYFTCWLKLTYAQNFAGFYPEFEFHYSYQLMLIRLLSCLYFYEWPQNAMEFCLSLMAENCTMYLNLHFLHCWTNSWSCICIFVCFEFHDFPFALLFSDLSTWRYEYITWLITIFILFALLIFFLNIYPSKILSLIICSFILIYFPISCSSPIFLIFNNWIVE